MTQASFTSNYDKVNQFLENKMNRTIIVQDLNSKKILYEKNLNRCFIAASLSKIITESYLIKIVLSKSGDKDINKAYETVVLKKIKRLPSHFFSLNKLFKTMNQYNRKTAPLANKVSDEALALIGTIFTGQNELKMANMKFGAEYILSNINKKECNQMVNGSGLALNNYFTSKQVSDELFFVFEHVLGISIQYNDFLQKPGQRSSMLEERLLALEGNAFLKTGSLRKNGILSLCGFLRKNGRFYSFVIIYNDIKNFKESLRECDSILLQIYKEL